MTNHAEDIAREHETGKARARASGKQERMAKVISDLLASAELAAARGDETEVDRLLAQASALQLKFAIADAMLHKDDREGIEFAEFCQESNTPLIKAKRELIAGLAGLYRGKAVMMPKLKRDSAGNIRVKNGLPMYDKRASIRVYAHQSDLDFIGQMYTSLILQMQSMMAADERTRFAGYDGYAHEQSIGGWRVSYAYAWVRRVYARLAEAKRRQEASETASVPGTALVLADRQALVVQHVTDNLGKLRSSRYRNDDSDPSGRAAGRAAGDRADLGQAKVGSNNQRQLEG